MNVANSAADSKNYQFGEWQFDPADGTLISEQSSTRLPPKLAKLLTIFVENVDVLLTRATLIDALWKDRSVNEDALSRCIAELRATLGDNSSSPVFIETVPKKGYRFIHPLNDSQPNKLFLNLKSVSVILIAIVSITTWYFYSFAQTDSSGQPQLATQLTSALIAAKRITADTDIEYQPELSSLGDKIVYSVVQDQTLIVKVMSTSGELLQEISDPDNHLYSATFSPDDQSLLLVALNNTSCQIYRYQLATLDRELIANCSEGYTPSILDWSPDGEHMAYVAKSQQSANQAIWIYQFSSKQHLQVTFPKDFSIFDTRPRFSSDGKKLSFLRGTSSINNIYMTNLVYSSEPDNLTNSNKTVDSDKTSSSNKTNSSDKKISSDKTSNSTYSINHDYSSNSDSAEKTIALTNSSGFINSFDWLANQQHIIYDSNELGHKNLWLLDIENKTQELLGARDGQYPSLNNSNSLLAHQEIHYNANIWKVDISKPDAVSEKIIESINYNNFPTYSPDGKQIAFVSNRQGRAAIWIYDLDTASQKKLMALPELDLISPYWSNNGQKMLVSSRGKNGYHCYQVDVATGQYHQLTAIKQAHSSCVYTSTGDILAIEKEPLKANQLLKLDGTGKLQVQIKASFDRIQLTDQDQIIFSLSNEEGLFAIDLDGTNRRTLIENFASRYYGYWTVQGSFLYYIKKQGDEGIWQRNLLTDEEKLMTKELPSAIGLTMSVSPDHSQLLLTKTDNRRSDLYISDLSQFIQQD